MSVHPLLIVREPGYQAEDDSVPTVNPDGTIPIHPSETVIREFRGEMRSYNSVGGKTSETVWEVQEPANLTLTDRRLAYTVAKFDTGSTYRGGLVVDTALLTAISRARAAYRRAGRIAIGQIDLLWVQTIKIQSTGGALKRKTYRRRHEVRLDVQDSSNAIVHLFVGQDPNVAVDIASEIARAVARRKLAMLRSAIDDDAIRALEATALDPSPPDSNLFWKLGPGTKIGSTGYPWHAESPP